MENEQQLIEKFLAEERASGGNSTPPPLPSQPQEVTFGGQKIQFTDAAQLQTELARREAAIGAELTALRNLAQTRQDTPPPTPQVVQAPAPRQANERWNLDTYAAELQKDPISAHDRALGMALGLENGVPASEALKAIAGAVQASIAQNAVLTKELESLRKDVTHTAVQGEGERFKKMHPEYVEDPGNAAIIAKYQQAYRLENNADGWDLALLKAKERGEPLKLVQQQQQQTTQAQQPYYQQSQGGPQAPFSGMPSLRQTGSGGDQTPAVAQMINYLDSLPQDKWREAVGRFEDLNGKVR